MFSKASKINMFLILSFNIEFRQENLDFDFTK